MSRYQKHIIKNSEIKKVKLMFELAHEKEMYFDRWYISRGVGTDFMMTLKPI